MKILGGLLLAGAALYLYEKSMNSDTALINKIQVHSTGTVSIDPSRLKAVKAKH